MVERAYLFSVSLNNSFSKAIRGIKKSLRDAEFEVISEINFSDIIEDRLGIKVKKKYLILEIVNPFMAYQSLLTTFEAGLFVPFRMVVFEDRDGNITVSLLNPEEIAGVTRNIVFKSITDESWKKLRDTLANLQHAA